MYCAPPRYPPAVSSACRVKKKAWLVSGAGRVNDALPYVSGPGPAHA